MFKLVVLSCVLASAAAGALISPFAPLAYTAPIASFAYTTPLLTPSNYRGPLSLAPGQPANILAADGRPLDTLDVNLDRSAHYTAKALSGVHLLKKRSVLAPIAYTAPVASFAYAAPLLTPSNYRGPLSLAPGQPANILAADGRPLDTLDVNLDRSAHFTAKALSGVHLLKKRSVVAPLTGLTVTHTAPVLTHAAHLTYSAPLITSPITYSAPIVRYY